MSSSDKSRALKVWSESVAKNMEMFQEGAEMMVRDHQSKNYIMHKHSRNENNIISNWHQEIDKLIW